MCAKVTIPDDHVAGASVSWSRRMAILLPSCQTVIVTTVGAAVALTRAVSGPPLRAVTVTSSFRVARAGTTLVVSGLVNGLVNGADVSGRASPAVEGDGESSPAMRVSTRPPTAAAAKAPATAATAQRGRTALVTAVQPRRHTGRLGGRTELGPDTSSAYESSASSAPLKGAWCSVPAWEAGPVRDDDVGPGATPETSEPVISPVGLTRKRMGAPASVAISSIAVPRSAAATTVRCSTSSNASAAVAALISSMVPTPTDQVPVPSRWRTASAATTAVVG